MKILHVNEHQALKGGVETYLYALLPLLRERGVDAAVAYGAGDPALHADAHCVPEIGTAGFGAQRAAREAMQAVLARVRPDVVHVHNVQNVGVLQACLHGGPPTVMTTHDYRWVCPANTFFYKRTQEICGRTCGLGCFPTTLRKHCLTPRPRYAAYFYYRARWAARHADAFARVIAPSAGARVRYLAGGFADDRVTVLPYFCSLDPAPEPRPLPERPTITFLGRVANNKGHEFFVQALGRLPERVQGLFVGGLTDEARAQLRALAEAEGCGDRLVLRGWASREEVLEIIDRTSVFVFPSLWPETLGIVGIEALSRGVPVVASDVGGVREWLEDGVNGHLVPPKDPDAIARAVDDLIGADERLRVFGRAGLDTIHRRFRPAQHVDRLVELYQAAVADAPTVPSEAHV